MQLRTLITIVLILMIPCFASADEYKNCSEKAEDEYLFKAFYKMLRYEQLHKTHNVEHLLPEAAELNKLALDDSPKCKSALYGLTHIYDRSGNYELTKKYNEKLLNLYPNDLQGRTNKGKLLAHEGRIAEATQVLEELIDEQVPDNGYWHYLLAEIHANDRNVSKALDHIEILVDRDKGWISRIHENADQTFEEVVKHERYKRLLLE